MRLALKEKGVAQEPRYDADTLRKVAALATRLQGQSQETLTAREMEAIGAEVGLKPHFIRQALTSLAPRGRRAAGEQERRQEFWALAAAFAIPLGWAVFADLWRSSAPLMTFLLLIAPLPLAGLLGFLVGRKKAGFTAGAWLILTLAPILFHWLMTHLNPPVWYSNTLPSEMSPLGWRGGGTTYELPDGRFQIFNDSAQLNQHHAIWYALMGAPLAGWLGWQGARVREHFFPLPSPRPVSRRELLDLLFHLQRQLEGQKQRCTFVSVDVVGSSEMKRCAPELAVEHSFDRYRSWVEGVVRSRGGEVQGVAGDGTMALFRVEAQALCAARQLQDELPRFNQEQNRLPQPFRLRCGVSAGEVAIEEGTPLGHLQSPVIDRAAALQKRAEPNGIVVSGEVTAAALMEPGQLTPFPEPVAGEPAFAWRPETRVVGDGR